MVSSGTLKLIEEKRMLSDVSALRKQKKQFGSFGPQELEIDGLKRKVDDIRKKLESFDPENRRLKKQFGDIIGKIKDLESANSKNYGQLKALFNQREKEQKVLNELYQKRREINSEFYRQKDVWSAYMRAEKARQFEEMKIKKEQYQREKRAEKIRIMLENAEVPAYESEIHSCNALIQLLSTHLPNKQSGGEVESTEKSNTAIPEVKDENLPKGVTGMVALKKKSDRLGDEAFFKASKKSKSKSKNSQQTSEKEFKFDLGVMEQFWALKIDVPNKPIDCEKSIKQLEDKKKFFFENQQRKTEENIKKAKQMEEAFLKEEAEREKNGELSGNKIAVNGNGESAEQVESNQVSGVESGN